MASGIHAGMDVSSHTVLLPAGADVPEWIHLIPAGQFSGNGVKHVLRDPKRVIAASMSAGEGKIPVDENHSTQRAPELGAPSPAHGYVVEMDARNDGIWGKVEWNETGRALMANKSYRKISPVFDYAKEDGAVTCILSVALTNNPALKQLTALHTSNGNDMDKKAICTALGISETMDDTALMAALGKAATSATALATVTTERDTARAELAAMERTHVPVEQVTALQARVQTIEGETKRAAATAFVDGAIKAGKPIAPVRDTYIAQHVANAAETEKVINALPSINAGGTGGARAFNDATADDEAMSAEETAVCAQMGIDHAAFKKTRAAMRKTTEGSSV